MAQRPFIFMYISFFPIDRVISMTDRHLHINIEVWIVRDLDQYRLRSTFHWLSYVFSFRQFLSHLSKLDPDQFGYLAAVANLRNPISCAGRIITRYSRFELLTPTNEFVPSHSHWRNV